VFIETSAGLKSGYGDDDFRAVGVEVVPDAADVYGRGEMIVKVKEPVDGDLAHSARITCCSVTCTSRRCRS
jgi:alanine dehydrogenase